MEYDYYVDNNNNKNKTNCFLLLILNELSYYSFIYSFISFHFDSIHFILILFLSLDIYIYIFTPHHGPFPSPPPPLFHLFSLFTSLTIDPGIFTSKIISNNKWVDLLLLLLLLISFAKIASILIFHFNCSNRTSLNLSNSSFLIIYGILI